LGAAKGGRVRAEILSAEERSAIASKAGKARMQTMTAKQRREIAKKAVEARWAKRKPEVLVDPEPASVRLAKAELRRNKKPAGVHPMVKER